MDWMIWKTADPQTTKKKSPMSQGETGYLSSLLRVDFGTFPLIVTILLAFSLAIRIRWLAAIVVNNY
jgi:hypothetical protein